MANEEFYTTLIALVLLVIVAVVAIRCCSGGMSSYFTAAVDVYTITLTTNKSYDGINSLVNELTAMQSTQMLYIVKDNEVMPVQVSATTDRKLSNNDVRVTDSMGVSQMFKRTTKNAIWNTDQSAKVRAPGFMTLFSIQSMPNPVKGRPSDAYPYQCEFRPGVTNYYIVSKTPSIHLAWLAKALNSEITKYDMTNEAVFFPCIDSSLPANEVRIYEGKFLNSTKLQGSYTDIDVKLVWNANRIDSFLGATGVFPEFKALRECKPDPAPPTLDVCDEKVNHCYMLRAYSKGSKCSQTGQYVQTSKNLTAVTEAYNRAVSRAGIVHPYSQKPVRFYGVHLPGGDNSPIVASIDRSGMEISESMPSVTRAVNNTKNFKEIESHVVDYLKDRMSAGPQQYF